MSYYIIRSIGFNKSKENFTATLASSNVYPKDYSTSPLFDKDADLNLNEKIRILVTNIFRGNFKLNPSQKSYFARCFAHAIYNRAKLNQEPIYSYYYRVRNNETYLKDYDPPELAPTEKDKIEFDLLIDEIEKNLLGNIPERMGKIRVSGPRTNSHIYEIAKVSEYNYYYTSVDYGKDFTLTYAILKVLTIRADAYFVELGEE